MKSEVIEYIKNNDYIEKLLLDFMDDFKSKYDLLEDKYKNEILEIKDEIFRNWLYCSMINETNITPNYLINNIVQEKYPGNYTVLPILHYNFNNNHLNLYIDFNYCSMYDHPIIKDVETLIDLSTPSIIFKYEYENENESLLHIEEKLLKEFTIESQYYVNYLIQLCEKLEIIKELRAIKCKCFQKSKESQFWKLENKEKFIKIVNATIDLSIENINNINNIQKKVGKSQIIRFLDNGINDNDFNNFINEVLPYANDFIENINQFTEDKSILETIKFAQVLMGDNVGTFIMGTEIRVYFDVYFTSVFSYYLSILSPTYLGTFLMEEIVGGMKESSSCFEKNASIFNEELEHDLSNLGIELMNKKGKIIKPRKNYSINLNDIDKLMEQAKLEKEEVVYRYRKCLEMYGDDKNMIHKFMSIIND